MARWTRMVVEIVRATFARETLPPPPPPAPGSPRVSRLGALFAPEHLPPPPPPTAPAADRPPGLLRVLFAPEALPEDPPAPPRPRGRWLAWLFAPERLDE